MKGFDTYDIEWIDGNIFLVKTFKNTVDSTISETEMLTLLCMGLMLCCITACDLL